ncbi:phospholipase A(1) DAD1, chloroplastic-like [Andrographis paniculata]|uniref:phospholipase A(1) DAD1, chloroplastic-like n=1 Tax=Andrographis paniculata TaxID=175694 RepID=UPI0021E70D71|nr:phospholipase A(1) DAD1, chloroplastic-like [Andrographis paniculata]
MAGPRNFFSVAARQCSPAVNLQTTSSQKAFNGGLKLAGATTSSWKTSTADSGEEGNLREKWREFQGVKNWDGLLDPLDDGLRREILRYGEFVEAAYRSFDFDTSSPDYATCLFPDRWMLARCGIGNTGYEVTKHLHATCGIQLPDWADRIPGWMAARSSWIGYVAVCTDEREIARLGRRDVVIAYRGTATCMEWLENLRATLACLPADMAPDCCQSMVPSGFLSLYTSRHSTCPSLQDSIREEVSRIVAKYADEPVSITVTGHSLGAALATLTAHDITTSFKEQNPPAAAPLVAVVSFGGPRVGNKSFRSQLEKNGTKVLRIVNSDDPITKIPGFVLEESSPPAVWRGNGILSDWVQRQWVYAEVGKELRLSSRDCPQINGGGFATCHDLKTYLHLVDNLVSSNCPLRATASRVLMNAANIRT